MKNNWKIVTICSAFALVIIGGIHLEKIPNAKTYKASLLDEDQIPEEKEKKAKDSICIDPQTGLLYPINTKIDEQNSCRAHQITLVTKSKESIKNNETLSFEFNTTLEKIYPDVDLDTISTITEGWDNSKKVKIGQRLYPVLFRDVANGLFGKIGFMPGTGWSVAVSTDTAGPQLEIQNLVASLEMIEPADEKTGKDLKKAITQLTKSTQSKYWQNKSTLSEKGAHVFEAHKEAIKLLQKADAHTTIINPIIENILTIDKQLTQKAIDEAMELLDLNGCTGSEAKDCEKAQEELEKAIASFGKATDADIFKKLDYYIATLMDLEAMKKKLVK